MDGKKHWKGASSKDLGVIIHAEFKFYVQCLAVANKANWLLGLIKTIFLCMTPEMYTSLYKALFRPVLEYIWKFDFGSTLHDWYAKTREHSAEGYSFNLWSIWIILRDYRHLSYQHCNTDDKEEIW